MRDEILKAKKIIFKFGTNILRNDDGEISLSRIYSFIEAISKLHKDGKEVIIVTSGAVGLGAKKLGIDIADSVQLKQACAAIGQTQLMSIYESGFDKYGIKVAQILLTEDDFSQRAKYLSLRNTLNQLLDMKVVPIINQNDTVTTTALEYYKDVVEVCFSDNDKLSALLASEMRADLLVILSDINYKTRTASLAFKRFAKKEDRMPNDMKNACIALLKYAFCELGLNCITTKTLIYNEKSLELQKRLGFKQEGVLRKRVFKNGQFQDLISSSLLAEEFNY